MYIKHVAGQGPQVIDVYVDDLIMLGCREGLADTLLRVRAQIDMEDPHELGKYLGCYHRVVEESVPARVRW